MGTDQSRSETFLLGQAEDWSRTFDAITDFVAVIDAQFHIRRVNRSMAAFLGMSPEALVGRRCFEVMHQRECPWPSCPHFEMLNRGEAVTLEVMDPHIGVPLLVTASPILGDDGELLGSIHVARDISLAKQAERDIQRINQELNALHHLSRRALESLTIAEVSDLVLETIMTVLAPDQAFIYLAEGGELVCQGVRPAGHFALPERKKIGVCLCGLAASERRPLYSPDIFSDARCTLTECKQAGVRAFAALPLAAGEELIGVLGLASRHERHFAEQGRFLETLAATVALAIKKALVFVDLERKAREQEALANARNQELMARNRELERMNDIFIDREFRIKALRDEISRMKGAGLEAGPATGKA